VQTSNLKPGSISWDTPGGNDYRLVAALQYRAGALAIRFFGTHNEHDRMDAVPILSTVVRQIATH
jgi:HigB_toxin, RelE-like toxic component of a toxin-antitoxin system